MKGIYLGESQVLQYFGMCSNLRPKQFKKVPTIVDSMVVVGVLTCCILLLFICNLKAKQIN